MTEVPRGEAGEGDAGDWARAARAGGGGHGLRPHGRRGAGGCDRGRLGLNLDRKVVAMRMGGEEKPDERQSSVKRDPAIGRGVFRPATNASSLGAPQWIREI